MNLATTTLPLTAEWGTTTIVYTAIAIPSFLLNVVLALVFIIDKEHRTPFNMYLVNLLVGNIAYMLCATLFELIAAVYSQSWWLGPSWCIVYTFGTWVPASLPIFSHLVIAINRIWASCRPISYRDKHNFKVALLTCLLVWVLAQFLGLPMVIAKLNSISGDGCDPNNASTMFLVIWGVVIFVVYMACIAAIIIAFPLVLWKTRRMLGNRIRNNTSSLNDRGKARRLQTLVFLIMTVSICIFWAPSTIVYAVHYFMDVEQEVMLGFWILFNTQMLMDPVVFVCTQRSVRTALVSFVCSAQTRKRGGTRKSTASVTAAVDKLPNNETARICSSMRIPKRSTENPRLESTELRRITKTRP